MILHCGIMLGIGTKPQRGLMRGQPERRYGRPRPAPKRMYGPFLAVYGPRNRARLPLDRSRSVKEPEMPAKQYVFEPQENDPRITAAQHWNDMRDELNHTRESLEHSEADRIAQASLIDMLRK